MSALSKDTNAAVQLEQEKRSVKTEDMAQSRQIVIVGGSVSGDLESYTPP